MYYFYFGSLNNCLYESLVFCRSFKIALKSKHIVTFDVKSVFTYIY